LEGSQEPNARGTFLSPHLPSTCARKQVSTSIYSMAPPTHPTAIKPLLCLGDGSLFTGGQRGVTDKHARSRLATGTSPRNKRTTRAMNPRATQVVKVTVVAMSFGKVDPPIIE
jgi:hypothetical protein